MKHPLHIIIYLVALLGTLTAGAQSLDEARTLAEDGDTSAAIDMLSALVAEKPSDTTAATLLGQLLWETGADDDAVTILEDARRRGNRDATLQLSRIALNRYDIDRARDLLAAYRKSLKSGKKIVAEDLSGSLEDQIDRAEGMLDRVQRIEIIDSVDVDAEEFFRHYPLPPNTGAIGDRTMLPSSFPADDLTTAHRTETGRRMVWSAPDAEGNSRLYASSPLLGGEWETPTPLGDELAEGGDAAFPYLMADGVTLYYANDGENSLGGYDIFLTRQGDDGFLQPANVGMPFNSPYNDYLLVIDDFNNVGWFATDRNRIPGKVTIYTFVPQDLRVNVPFDDPNLSHLASLDNIQLTQKQGVDYKKTRREIAARAKQSPAATDSETAFRFPLPDGRVITSLSQMRSPQGREALATYLDKEAKLQNINDKLLRLRAQYATGDHSNAELILQLEGNLDAARAELQRLRNRVIAIEMH